MDFAYSDTVKDLQRRVSAFTVASCCASTVLTISSLRSVSVVVKPTDTS